MCGIAGYLLSREVETSADTILGMIRSVAHRGPDDEGLTLICPDSASGIDLTTNESAKRAQKPYPLNADGTGLPHRIAFAHRRFSIIDVSEAGHQPFWSSNRKVCVCFNGEIYNYVELRAELNRLGHEFHTGSDTEVLAEAYLEWGAECFKRFNGFWALCLYDADRGRVLLSRDRIGKAPLYLTKAAKGLFWCSEIKGLWEALGTSTFPVRDQAVSDFVLYGWRDHFHQTFYQGVVTFPNASYAWLEPDGRYEPKKFWTLPNQRLGENDLSTTEAIQEFRQQLCKAVKLRLRADVPVGFELSGGMDSSALVGLAVESTTSINAFTVSFPGTESDEEFFAKKVVELYPGRIHYSVLKPSQEDFFLRADSYVWLMEEPFHSPNLLTNQGTWHNMAQTGIRVSINGAAGDELLAGYAGDYHGSFLRWLLQKGRLLRFIREFFSFSERGSEVFGVDTLRRAYQLLPNGFKVRKDPATSSAGADPFRRPLVLQRADGPSQEIHQRLLDNMGDWRMNYWMRSGNKSAMGVPVEVRAPFLDYGVVDFAFRLPVSYLIRNGWMKWILRQAVKDVLPPQVVWRKTKVGFPFPYAEWFTSSRERFFLMLGGLDCPYLDLPRLRAAYSELSLKDPLYLWRLFSVGLWWKRCILGDRLL